MENDVYSLRETTKDQNKEIAYYHTPFWKRVTIIMFDTIIFALLALGIFIGLRAIVAATPDFKANNDELTTLKLDSNLFIYDYSTKNVTDIVTYYNQSTDVAQSKIEKDLTDRLELFFTFMGTTVSSEVETTIRTEYDSYRMELENNGQHYFVKDGAGVISKNTTAAFTNKQYNEDVYKPYIDKYGQGYFTTRITRVIEITKYNSNLLLLFEIPVAITLGFTIVFYVIPMCFSRGKKTLGRLLMKSALVDKNVLSVSWKRFTIRFLIMFFGEIVLSVFTLGVPLIISFSMMAFSKKKQNFHDYLLGIEEIDTTSSVVYKSKSEVYKSNVLSNSVDFKQR